jgi:hypothetical protein
VRLLAATRDHVSSSISTVGARSFGDTGIKNNFLSTDNVILKEEINCRKLKFKEV